MSVQTDLPIICYKQLEPEVTGYNILQTVVKPSEVSVGLANNDDDAKGCPKILTSVL